MWLDFVYLGAAACEEQPRQPAIERPDRVYSHAAVSERPPKKPVCEGSHTYLALLQPDIA